MTAGETSQGGATPANPATDVVTKASAEAAADPTKPAISNA